MKKKKGNDKKYDFYFASPFFNEEQVEREERLKAKLRSLGYVIYSPKEASNLKADASIKDREKTFKENLKAIKKSRAVFAITDGKDVGTIWEAGYAYGKKIPIIYFAETLGDKPFNLMLAQSGCGVFKDCVDVIKLDIEAALEGTFGAATYGGLIE